jgi:putative spermidine/putrescine transport system permease protein
MRIAMGGAAALTLLFLMAPVLALVPMSFSGTRWLTLPPSDLSLRWYAELVTDRDWRQAIGTSLAVGASATVVAAVLGTLAGAALARARFPGREVVRGVVLAPLIVPAMLLAIAFYHLFARLGLVGTATALVLAHAVLAVPYVVLNVEAVMRTFDRRLERADAGGQRLAGLPPGDAAAHAGGRARRGAVRVHHVVR